MDARSADHSGVAALGPPETKQPSAYDMRPSTAQGQRVCVCDGGISMNITTAFACGTCVTECKDITSLSVSVPQSGYLVL